LKTAGMKIIGFFQFSRQRFKDRMKDISRRGRKTVREKKEERKEI
jgi:hypothetical protein